MQGKGFGPAEIFEAGGKGSPDPKSHRPTFVTSAEWTTRILGQREWLDPFELSSPVLEETFRARAADAFTLPDGIVLVMKAQCGEHRSTVLAGCIVELTQVLA